MQEEQQVGGTNEQPKPLINDFSSRASNSSTNNTEVTSAKDIQFEEPAEEVKPVIAENVVPSTPTVAPTATENTPDTITPLSSEAPVTNLSTAASNPPLITQTSSPHKAKRTVFLIASVILLLGAGSLAAWQMLKKDTPKKTETTQTSQPAKGETKKAVAKLSLVSRDGPLNVFPPNYSPQEGTQQVIRHVYESLATFENQNKITPQLADSWTNPDANSWVIKLKSGIKFQNSKVLSSTEVKSSIEAEKAIAANNIFTSTIQKVEIVDPLTIKITTTKTDPLLPNRLAFLPIFDVNAEKTGINFGTGAYMLKKDTSVKTDNIELSVFKDFHGGVSMLPEITFTQIIDPVKFNQAVVAGTYDIAEGVPPSQIKALTEKYPKGIQSQIGGSGVVVLLINSLKTGPLQKKQVREALVMAIDQKKLLPLTGANSESIDTLSPNSILRYSSSYKRPTYDVEKTKKNLSDASFSKGFSLTIGELQQDQAIADEIVKELALVGITLKNTVYTDAIQFSKDVIVGKLDLFLDMHSTQLNDFGNFASTLFQKGIYNLYSSAQIDAKLKSSSTELDAVKRQKTLEEVSDDLLTDVAAIPLYIKNTTVFAQKNFIYQVDYPMSSVIGANFHNVYEK